MSGLLKLKSVFSPTNTKFQENQSDLTTFDSKFDDGLNVPIKSNLLNLDSKFDDGLNIPIQSNLLDLKSQFNEQLNDKVGLYISNKPVDSFDTKLNYNNTNLVTQTYNELNVSLLNRSGRDNPSLDALLRGRVYDPIRFSQNFSNENLFVSPESFPFESIPFSSDSFDPRAPFAKQGTLYFNTGFSLSGNAYTNTNDLDLNNQIFIQNNPQDKFDSKFEPLPPTFSFFKIPTTFGTPGTPPTWHPNVPGSTLNISVSPLDNLLRGKVYEQVRFSNNFSENRQFVNDINDPIGNHPFRTETFDPRAGLEGLIKDRTIYQNTNNSFNPATKNPEVTFGTAGVQSPYQGGDIFNSVHGGNYGAGGVDLESLGVSFYNGENSDKNLSWESLYNSNHTPKNNPKWQGGNLEALNYGSIVNRDNLNINYNVGGDGANSATRYGEKSGIIGAFSRRSIFGGGEPYIISDIGDDSKTRGGRFAPNRRANADGSRLAQFLLSEEGLSFMIQQNINIPIENTVVRSGDGLERVPQRFGVTYNPFSTLGVQSTRFLGQGPNILIRKSGFDLFSGFLEGIGNVQRSLEGGFGGETAQKLADLLSPTEYGPSATSAGYSINDTFTSGNSADGGGLLSQLTDAFKSLGRGGTTVTKTSAGDKVTLANMVSGKDLDDLKYTSIIPGLTSGTTATVTNTGANTKTAVGVDIEAVENGMPFYFKDLRDDTYIFFRAFIEGLTENISPSYSSHNYIGRSEPVYTYERAEREISMTLKLFAQTKGELDKIYEKMDRLTSLCYPQYEKAITKFSLTGDYGNRMKPPLTKLRYGELFGKKNKELMGYIKSISYSIDQSSPYEVEVNKRVPKHVLATIGYQVIHDKVPSIDTKFYGINQ